MYIMVLLQIRRIFHLILEHAKDSIEILHALADELLHLGYKKIIYLKYDFKFEKRAP